MTSTATGRSTGGKVINLHQLNQEMVTAGLQAVAPPSGLGMAEGYVYTYDADGMPADFAAGDQATVDQCIASHTAMRDKYTSEYSAEFQDSNTSVARKQEIRDIQNGLLPPEKVPMTEADLVSPGAAQP